MLTQIIIYFKAKRGQLIAKRVFDHRCTAATAGASTGTGFYVCNGVRAAINRRTDSPFGHVITRTNRCAIRQALYTHERFFNVG